MAVSLKLDLMDAFNDRTAYVNGIDNRKIVKEMKKNWKLLLLFFFWVASIDKIN